MASGETGPLIEAAVRLGDASRGGDPHLWSEVLEHLVARPAEESSAAIAEAQPGHCP